MYYLRKKYFLLYLVGIDFISDLETQRIEELGILLIRTESSHFLQHGMHRLIWQFYHIYVKLGR